MFCAGFIFRSKFERNSAIELGGFYLQKKHCFAIMLLKVRMFWITWFLILTKGGFSNCFFFYLFIPTTWDLCTTQTPCRRPLLSVHSSKNLCVCVQPCEPCSMKCFILQWQPSSQMVLSIIKKTWLNEEAKEGRMGSVASSKRDWRSHTHENEKNMPRFCEEVQNQKQIEWNAFFSMTTCESRWLSAFVGFSTQGVV